MIEVFFFDSYALFEIVNGSKNYERYTKTNIVTTKLNLFELYYGLLKDADEKTALVALEKYFAFTVNFDRDVIEHAAKLRLIYKKWDLSMTDCIGYIIAKKLGIKFLTGDKQFENMENVEFVK